MGIRDVLPTRLVTLYSTCLSKELKKGMLNDMRLRKDNSVNSYDQYLEESLRKLRGVLEDMGCRPILFVGSGITRRYIKGPSWPELMSWLIQNNPRMDLPYPFYYQKAEGRLPGVGSLLVEPYQTFAWESMSEGIYPEHLYGEVHPADIFLKATVCSRLDELLRDSLDSRTEEHPFEKEINQLRRTEPHAIITTNYDQFMERIFPDFEVVIGQQIIRKNPYVSIGEILKIHGCVSDPGTIVLHEQDYEIFTQKKKYLTAKLLTYFIEFPMIFLGYSATDENIKSILKDIAEMIPSSPDERLNNLWLVLWNPDSRAEGQPPSEKVIDLGGGNSVRVNLLVVDGFISVFEALSRPLPVNNVNVKLLRTLSANVYYIITNKSAKSEVEVNLVQLRESSDREKLSKVLGFAEAEPADALLSNYPYTLTEVGQALGFRGWHGAHDLIMKIFETTEFHIKKSNNRYHQGTKYGKMPINRYSAETIELLYLVMNGKEYTLVTETGKEIKVPNNPEVGEPHEE
jgi:hypothetical protein